jgi:DNA topoisomerase-1
VKHGGINATVPRDLKLDEVTLDQAVALLAERAAKGGGKKPARAKKAPKAETKTKTKTNGLAVAAPANDTEVKPKTAKKKSAPKSTPKRKTKTDAPPRTGTDG